MPDPDVDVGQTPPLTGPQLITNINASLQSLWDYTDQEIAALLASVGDKVVLPSDVTNNNGVANTIADVTGLQFPVVTGGKYAFRFVIAYTAAATTTGSRWSVNGPAFNALHYKSEYSLTSTSKTVNEGLSAYDLPAASNASSAATASNIAVIEGMIDASANGNVVARFASEVSSSAIVAKGGLSYVEYRRLN